MRHGVCDAHETYTFGIRDVNRAVVCFSFQFYEGSVRFWQAKNGAYGSPPKLAQANIERLFYEHVFGERMFLNLKLTRIV